jgi:peptide/nickel transport system substrate-binding protein
LLRGIRWERSPDGLTRTFHLRRGVEYHGTSDELDAEYVRHSQMRAADPKRSSFSGDLRAIVRP